MSETLATLTPEQWRDFLSLDAMARAAFLHCIRLSLRDDLTLFEQFLPVHRRLTGFAWSPDHWPGSAFHRLAG